MPFPLPNFNYGGELDVSVAENEILIHLMSHDHQMYGLSNVWFSTVKPDKRRNFFSSNRLKQDETPLINIDSGHVYWRMVTNIAPPRDWIKKSKLFTYLAKARPKDKVSNYKFWVATRNWLDEVIRQGDLSDWSDEGTLNPPVTDEEIWEAIRIVGDSQDGYGTYPKAIKEKMTKAGFNWIAVNPKYRIIPKCWQSWANHYGFSYAAAQPIQSRPKDVQELAGPWGLSNANAKRNGTDIEETGQFQSIQHGETIQHATCEHHQAHMVYPTSYDDHQKEVMQQTQTMNQNHNAIAAANTEDNVIVTNDPVIQPNTTTTGPTLTVQHPPTTDKISTQHRAATSAYTTQDLNMLETTPTIHDDTTTRPANETHNTPTPIATAVQQQSTAIETSTHQLTTMDTQINTQQPTNIESNISQHDIGPYNLFRQTGQVSKTRSRDSDNEPQESQFIEQTPNTMKFSIAGQNPTAMQALQDLIEKEPKPRRQYRMTPIRKPMVKRPSTRHLWHTTERNFRNIASDSMYLYNRILEDAQEATKEILKDAIFDGAVEGRMREILDETIIVAFNAGQQQRLDKIEDDIEKIKSKVLANDSYQIAMDKQMKYFTEEMERMDEDLDDTRVQLRSHIIDELSSDADSSTDESDTNEEAKAIVLEKKAAKEKARIEREADMIKYCQKEETDRQRQRREFWQA
ncbi:hypothetical protein GGS21DRAFT_494253 [Xylaria nigripes]|nr:hypothetical protein GGS21DRAFT_494253 [Xylaria nigripes]